jgi:hypothetical protein
LPLAIVIDTEKAAVATRMAGNAGRVAQLANPQKNNVLIAIAANFMHGLHVAGLFPLEPKLSA